MIYFTLQVMGGFAIAVVLGALCYLSARTLRLQRRASRQLRLSREMRRTFEDELQQFPRRFPDMSPATPFMDLRASS